MKPQGLELMISQVLVTLNNSKYVGENTRFGTFKIRVLTIIYYRFSPDDLDDDISMTSVLRLKGISNYRRVNVCWISTD